MPFTVTSVIQRNQFSRKKKPAYIASGASTKIFDDITKMNDYDQIVSREVYNAGPTAVYYRYGETCIAPTLSDPLAIGVFDGVIGVGQLLNLETLEDFYVYASGGVTTLGLVEIKRDNMAQPAGVLTENKL